MTEWQTDAFAANQRRQVAIVQRQGLVDDGHNSDNLG